MLLVRLADGSRKALCFFLGPTVITARKNFVFPLQKGGKKQVVSGLKILNQCAGRRKLTVPSIFVIRLRRLSETGVLFLANMSYYSGHVPCTC
jgi:hypothetical protein